MPSTKKNKKSYSKKDMLDKDEFDPKHARFRVTMYVDLPVLEKIRDEAKDKSLPYQTYINQILRQHVLKDQEERIRQIVQDELKKSHG